MSFLSIITAASTAAESAAESIAETVAETAAEGGAVTSMVPEDFAFDYSMRVPVLSIILNGDRTCCYDCCSSVSDHPYEKPFPF